MDNEMKQFQKDLLDSVRQMVEGKATDKAELALRRLRLWLKSVFLSVYLPDYWVLGCVLFQVGSNVVGKLPATLLALQAKTLKRSAIRLGALICVSTR